MIEQLRTEYTINRLCQCLGTSRSGYYAWRTRKPSKRARRHLSLLKLIVKSFQTSKQTYGYPRVHADLTSWGEVIGRHQVAGLMRTHGLVAKMKRKRSGHSRMRRLFNAEADRIGRCPDSHEQGSIWVADITQVNTTKEPFFLAVVMDKFSRRVIGLAMGERHNSALVCRALTNAFNQCPNTQVTLVHSDQGVEYNSYRYRNMLKDKNIERSISRKGNCYDNAHMESFFHSLKTEMIYFQNFISANIGMRKVREYIQYYNNKRRHSSLGYLSPVQFEAAIG